MEETTQTDSPEQQEAAPESQLANLVWGASMEPAGGGADASQTREIKEWVPNVWWNWSPAPRRISAHAPCCRQS